MRWNNWYVWKYSSNFKSSNNFTTTCLAGCFGSSPRAQSLNLNSIEYSRRRSENQRTGRVGLWSTGSRHIVFIFVRRDFPIVDRF